MKQKVLVMGGSYFIGKKLVEILLEKEYIVFTLNRGTKEVFDKRINNLICDRNDSVKMQELLKDKEFDIVIDISGLNKVQADILYNSLRLDTLKTFIFVSSSAVYDVENLRTPYTEEDALSRNVYWTSYGENKIEAEHFYTENFKNTKTNLIMIRPPYVYGENNYGERESFIFEHISKDKPIIIPKTNPKLQFIYTLDLANIILALLSKDLPKVSIFNVGNRKSVTAREWVEACAKAMHKTANIIEYDYKKYERNIRDFFPFYDYDNVLDVTKINQIYAFETEFEEGLKNAYSWYIENKNNITFKENVARNEVDILKGFI